MIGIDLFAGAGGMSLGAINAGIAIHLAVEKDAHAARTYAHNHPNTTVFSADIATLREVTLPHNAQQTIIFGGPPCKGFSTSNQKTRNRGNENNSLFLEYLRMVRMVRPDWVLFENVKGILETESKYFINKIEGALRRYGYTLTSGILNAANFGVPQNRYRYFIIGSRHGIRVDLPSAAVTRFVTVKEAIGDLPVLENGDTICRRPYRALPQSDFARQLRGGLTNSANHLVTKNAPWIVERFRHVPQGGNWENIPSVLMSNYKNREGCHTGIYHRLHIDQPSKVIGNYRKNMLIHPEQDRGLSVREAARLQSFPDWFEFQGSIGFQQQQVGNAVPPLLAKAVFEKILSHA